MAFIPPAIAAVAAFAAANATAIAIATTAISVIGTGISAVSQAKQQKAQGEYEAASLRNQASVEEFNSYEDQRDAEFARQNALSVGFTSQENAQFQDETSAREIGDLEAAQAVSGLTGGSQQNVRRTLALLSSRDRSRARVEGDNQAAALRQQSHDFSVNAANRTNNAVALKADATNTLLNAKRSARSTLIGGAIEAVGTIAGGLGEIASLGSSVSSLAPTSSSAPTAKPRTSSFIPRGGGNFSFNGTRLAGSF